MPSSPGVVALTLIALAARPLVSRGPPAPAPIRWDEESAARLPPDAFARAQAESAARNPSDVHFSVSTDRADGRYRIGEVIELRLRFIADTPARYGIYGNWFGCMTVGSGEEAERVFVSESEGLLLPQANYRSFQPGLRVCSGMIRQPEPLSRAPKFVTLPLPLWVRFTRPGSYQFFLTTYRLERFRHGNGPGSRSSMTQDDDVVPLTSARITVTIEPADEAADRREIQAAELRAFVTDKAAELGMTIADP